MAAPKSLKAQNIPWIVAVLAVDGLALLAFAYPAALDGDVFSAKSTLKSLAAGVAPVLVLLLTSLFSSDAKAMLVYWRVQDVLPGHRAFSVYAQRDSRVDVAALQKNVGPLPTAPRDQNTLWYKLYKEVESDVIVTEANRHYLLFRDLSAVSLILAPLATVALFSVGSEAAVLGLAAAAFIAQYLATAIAARHNGIRLVCNVLALHGTAEPGPRAKRGRKKPAA